MNFQIGEKIVYPNQGVGVIENISTRTFGATREQFYLLRFGSNSMTVVVPCASAANIGLRRVTQQREIASVLTYLSDGHVPVKMDWKARYKENSDKMQSNDLLKIAEVLKSLLAVHSERPLSFREKKMLDRARYMLTSEIATASDLTETQAREVLQASAAKAGFKLPPD